MRARLAGLILLLPLSALAAPGSQEQAQLAWRSAQGDELLRLGPQQVLDRQPLPAELKAPLGSLWKLFVYAWLNDTGQQEPAYQCRGENKEEVYCCTAGQSIERDAALVKSCGLYFEPQRLGIDGAVWQQYWQVRHAPGWIAQLDKLAAQTEVPVAELLDQLQHLPAQEQAQKVLLDVSLAADEGRAPASLGGRLRVKTWSWDENGKREGGFAGWLVDGTPLWARGPGTSKTVLAKYGNAIGAALPAPGRMIRDAAWRSACSVAIH